MVKPGDINQQQQFANDAVQAYKDTQAKKAETSKAIEDNATKFAKGGISGGMSTGNKVLDKLQQNKREKQPQKIQPQPMYDKNGNRIIQGNGRFEKAQRLAAGQDQVFQNPTGYDVGAVVNQVSQNNRTQGAQPQGAQPQGAQLQGAQLQGAQPQGTQAQNIFTARSGNRRFDNAMGYLSNTFNGKVVTTDDGKKVDASRYFQDNLAKLLSNTNNPKALMYGLRSLQEDMARRGVGNFDISGELLKGTGMTDSGFAKQLWGNRQSYLGMLQPNGGSNNKKDSVLPPPPPPKPKYTHASSKNNYENARANTIVSDDPYKPPVQKNYGSKPERLSARIRAIEANGERNGQLSSEEYEELTNLKKQYNDYMRGVQYHTKGPSWADEINDNLTIRGSKGIRPEGWMDRATRWLNRNAPSVMLTNKNK